MNSVDFSYLVMLDLIKSDAVLSQYVDLTLAYDKKYVTTKNKDTLYLYEVSKNVEFFGIGAEYVQEYYVTSANYLTRSRRRLGIFEKRLNEYYTGLHYAFWYSPDAGVSLTLEPDVDYTDLVEVGSYIDKIILIDPDLYDFKRGDVIQVVGSGYDYGFVWGVYGNELYVFYAEGEYILTIVERSMNVSEKYKGFFEMNFDLTGKIIRRVV